ncbi:hypothetical protein TNCV_2455231 [Trichonephila clavipes]|nr:hypothetical protein TNCV_2455231 [Trichonephila clavipes]
MRPEGRELSITALEQYEGYWQPARNADKEKSYLLEELKGWTGPVVGQVRGVERGIIESSPAVLGVPFVAAAHPRQFRSHGGHHEVYGPANDHVVVERHVPRDQDGAEAHA